MKYIPEPEIYRVEREIENLAYVHRYVDNDPDEPYRAVSSIFNADAYAQGLHDREAWEVISPYEIRHLPEVRFEILGLD